MTSDPTLMKKFQAVFNKWQDLGYIKLIQDDNPTRPNLWYWPHFPVIKEEKETTKIRPVFDGTAKFRGVCMNDYIQTGPSVMNELVAVVHRFRQFDHAMRGDFCGMRQAE
jgi:hypothetical protein